MAAGTLPSPGTQYGPCAGPCAHTDCAQTRAMATTICRICPKPIGYDEPFFKDQNGKLVHAGCLIDETEGA